MYQTLPVFRSGEKYLFNSFLGITYSITGYDQTSDRISLSDDCHFQTLVKNPYHLLKRERGDCPPISGFARIYARLLVFLWKHCYPGIWLLSHCRFSLFKDAGEANLAFREILKNSNQNILCLPRSVFIATTSSRFKKNGALFIGCFFPSRHLHAWVIEDRMHADIFDHQWIMFTPLVMMK